MTPPENNRELADATIQCGQDAAFMQAILDVYADVERSSREEKSLCLGGGACCRFDLFDHRLYVTLGELALLNRSGPGEPSRLDNNRCPYQQGPRCLARENRPLGCRVFFCREKLDSPDIKDYDAYEAMHERIGELHAKHGVPYAYVELIAALKILREFCR